MSANKKKLIGAVLSLLAAVAMIIMGTYAWLTASTSPTAEGIQIMIGGGNAIYLAPDITDADGNHYPGEFTDTLKLCQSGNLSYVSGLHPVSTADGLHWYLPTYYSQADAEVQSFQAKIGSLKPVSEYIEDTTLQYANLDEDADSSKGSYLYMDFWVVSLNSDMNLHVATSDESGIGTYALALQDVVKSADGSGYTLQTVSSRAAESLRVGFLVNQNAASSGDMSAYAASSDFVSKYRNLRGTYQEKGETLSEEKYLNSFTIYEPNGDSHCANAELDGKYVQTNPVGIENGTRQEVGIGDRLCVQLTNRWIDATNEIFRTACLQAEKEGVSDTERDLEEYFYSEYLEEQTSAYVQKGRFITSTPLLYMHGVATGNNLTVTSLENMETAGASDTRIVTLDKNVPQRVRMYIWLEGQDVDCAQSASADRLALSIELSGSMDS